MRVTNGGDRVRIALIDNGIGIPAENLSRVFNHGFTTKKDGHGFGLHSSCLAAKEMQGTLTAHSDGTGKGATFTLELPCQPQEGKP
jgi:signal transduction histidine kinase